MPTTKDFKTKKQKANPIDVDEAVDTVIDAAAAHRPKRRPGRSQMEEDIAETKGASTSEDSQQKFDIESEEPKTTGDADGEEFAASAKPKKAKVTSEPKAASEGDHASTGRHRGGSDEDLARLEREAEEPADAPKIEIHFSGSELIRSRFPTPFALAEAVATDWVYGGEFDKLPINQPLAKFAAQAGLQKAKELEKKVLESPRFEKAAMDVLMAGMKVQGFVSQLREKIKK